MKQNKLRQMLNLNHLKLGVPNTKQKYTLIIRSGLF